MYKPLQNTPKNSSAPQNRISTQRTNPDLHTAPIQTDANFTGGTYTPLPGTKRGYPLKLEYANKFYSLGIWNKQYNNNSTL